MKRTRRQNPFTPAGIDALTSGRICDPEVLGLRIEVVASGRKRWKFRRRFPGSERCAKSHFGYFPEISIAQAREWARELNAQVLAGINPRKAAAEQALADRMTVARAHRLYMIAVHEGRSSRAKRPNKPRTAQDKLEMYKRDIEPKLGRKLIHEIKEDDLVRLVLEKGRTARIRANRLAAELKVFFGWAASLRGLEVGLMEDPARRLADLRFPETARSRKLGEEELVWFLQALVHEERVYQRGMLLWLLTAARLAEVETARSDEICGGVWVIPAAKTKNSVEHRIPLGPWGLSLMRSDDEWVFPAPAREGPRSRMPWYKARNRVKARMDKLAGRPIERFTPHDFRRTVRSNTKRLRIDFETAEAMLNHVKKGLERTYDRYDLEEEKRLSFLRWELEVGRLARVAGVAAALGSPDPRDYSALAPSLSRPVLQALPSPAGPAGNSGMIHDPGLSSP